MKIRINNELALLPWVLFDQAELTAAKTTEKQP